MNNQTICMPLWSNVPDPQNSDWVLKQCPVCGEDCWESELARQVLAEFPGVTAACTACALAGRRLMRPKIQVKVWEHRYLTADALYQLCVGNRWYTMGNSGEYAGLFALLEDSKGGFAEMTTERLTQIAVDIAEHSDGGKAMLGTVLHALAKACEHIFYIE